MKKIFILSITLFVLVITRAQIPNYSFENWSNGPNGLPDGWSTGCGGCSDDTVIHQSTDRWAGQYSARINQWIIGTDTMRRELVTSNNAVLDTGAPQPVFALNQQHTSFKGYFKYSSQNGDSAQFFCILFKHGFNNSYPGAPQGMLDFAGATFGSPVTTWSPFSINFQSFDSTGTIVPDSGWIDLSPHVFYRGNNNEVPIQGNAWLMVDALSFDNFITGINEAQDITSGFSLTPTIGDGNIHLNYSLVESNHITIKVYDLNAHEISVLFDGNKTEGKYFESYDIPNLAKGVYLLMVSSENGFHAEKFLIQR
jgi:Secretion system C-terminal sorting domain